jgi:hypothetical protein
MKTTSEHKREKVHYNDEPAYQAAIPHQPYRKRSPKRKVRTHVSNRVKKGPLESKG